MVDRFLWFVLNRMEPGKPATWLRQWLEKREADRAIAAVCQKAMQRADFRAEHATIGLSDIGLLVYHSPKASPRIVREGRVMDDAHWIRPFYALQSSTRQPIKVQLAIYDQHDALVFTTPSKIVNMRKGSFRLVPDHWLPLAQVNHPLDGRWHVVVIIDDVLLAVHPFRWEQIGESALRNNLANDGEIDNTLQREVKFGQFERMSLDELLAHQKD